MKYSNYEIVKKLIGEIEAIGESNEDEKRYNNLEETILLIDSLIVDVRLAANDVYRLEGSMQKIGKRSFEFLEEISSDLKSFIENKKIERLK